MDTKECIIKTENEFPKMFASYIEKEYGILFYDENNKQSHDSNHAVLSTDIISDIANVLVDITDFYLNKGITPMIYQSPATETIEKYRHVFENAGYEVQNYGLDRFMLLTDENTIHTKKTLEIKRLLEWDDRIATDIFIPNGEEYEIDVARNSLQHKDSFLFVGYLDNVAVTTTYFHKSEYGCTRFDYIVTAKEHRKKGYAREILSHVVDYCKANKIPNCYQWPAQETSAKICYEAGFRVLFEAEAYGAVYIK